MMFVSWWLLLNKQLFVQQIVDIDVLSSMMSINEIVGFKFIFSSVFYEQIRIFFYFFWCLFLKIISRSGRWLWIRFKFWWRIWLTLQCFYHIFWNTYFFCCTFASSYTCLKDSICLIKFWNWTTRFNVPWWNRLLNFTLITYPWCNLITKKSLSISEQFLPLR